MELVRPKLMSELIHLRELFAPKLQTPTYPYLLLNVAILQKKQ